MSKVDYKASGVDVEAGDALVDWLQAEPGPSSDQQNRIRSGIGGFASLFDISFPQMKKPLLITCTDGVGTKVQLASYFDDYSTVGQDLVAMCINDLLCCGGQPLQFLDYYATGKLSLPRAKEFLKGVRRACEESHCTLIGGETAEMPGLYHGNDFDCAGFAVGIVDETEMWGPHRVQAGDKLIGLASSGFHSNGYSLLRNLFKDEFEKYRTWLMEPTRIYYQALQSLKTQQLVLAAAHITGGGVQNIPRALPAGLTAKLSPWSLSDAYQEVQKRSGLDFFELSEVLNCGLGFVLVVRPHAVAPALALLKESGLQAWEVGEVVSNADSESRVFWDKVKS